MRCRRGVLMLTGAVRWARELRERGKKRQTRVCCLSILLILPVRSGDVMRNNSLGFIWGMEFASRSETCISSIFLFDPSSLQQTDAEEKSLFSSIHSLNVRLVMCFKLFALQLEGICHQTSFRGPRFRTQTNFHGNFKLFQACWDGVGKNRNAKSWKM